MLQKLLFKLVKEFWVNFLFCFLEFLKLRLCRNSGKIPHLGFSFNLETSSDLYTQLPFAVCCCIKVTYYCSSKEAFL